MARAKKESCEFCECGFDGFLRISSEVGDDLILELYPGHLISASAILRSESGETEVADVEIPMNYCPVCGRRWEI